MVALAENRIAQGMVCFHSVDKAKKNGEMRERIILNMIIFFLPYRSASRPDGTNRKTEAMLEAERTKLTSSLFAPRLLMNRGSRGLMREVLKFLEKLVNNNMRKFLSSIASLIFTICSYRNCVM